MLSVDCLFEGAKFFTSERGTLQHVKTGFCIQPLDEELQKLLIFEMTFYDFLQLVEFDDYVQPEMHSSGK